MKCPTPTRHILNLGGAVKSYYSTCKLVGCCSYPLFNKVPTKHVLEHSARSWGQQPTHDVYNVTFKSTPSLTPHQFYNGHRSNAGSSNPVATVRSEPHLQNRIPVSRVQVIRNRVPNKCNASFLRHKDMTTTPLRTAHFCGNQNHLQHNRSYCVSRMWRPCAPSSTGEPTPGSPCSHVACRTKITAKVRRGGTPTRVGHKLARIQRVSSKHNAHVRKRSAAAMGP